MLTCLCQFCCCHRESCAERRHWVWFSLTRTVDIVRPLSLTRTCQEMVVMLQSYESNSFTSSQFLMNSDILGNNDEVEVIADSRRRRMGRYDPGHVMVPSPRPWATRNYQEHVEAGRRHLWSLLLCSEADLIGS
jgi:hypothetical protein